jgi:integrase
MTGHTTMVALAREYLGFRRKMGFVVGAKGEELLRFARYADQNGHRGPITTELAVQWATHNRGSDPSRHAKRLDNVRQFARYRALFDPRNEVPPEGLLGPSYRRKPPYIYTDEEIEVLLEAASGLIPANGLRPHTYVTLFGLLACTGLRISEALRLTRSEVDLDKGVLTVVKTKFRKSRLVPVHPSTVDALSRYVEHRDSYHPLTRSRSFFLDGQGTPLKYDAVLTTFRRLRDRLGWTRSGGRSPRIHDMRHGFAVRRLLAWYEEGVEVDRKVAALSTYMGHANVKDTYWYFTAVPELLAVAGSRFERFTREVNLRGDRGKHGGGMP